MTKVIEFFKNFFGGSENHHTEKREEVKKPLKTFLKSSPYEEMVEKKVAEELTRQKKEFALERQALKEQIRQLPETAAGELQRRNLKAVLKNLDYREAKTASDREVARIRKAAEKSAAKEVYQNGTILVQNKDEKGVLEYQGAQYVFEKKYEYRDVGKTVLGTYRGRPHEYWEKTGEERTGEWEVRVYPFSLKDVPDWVLVLMAEREEAMGK